MDLKPKLKVLIINGPNLNLLGTRQPEIYGILSFEDYLEELRTEFEGCYIDYFQPNQEGDLIDAIQKCKINHDGLIINPGGFTHTSIGIRDAIEAINMPTVEVHISNILEREAFRQNSLISDVCYFSIIGMGMKGYRMAILRLREILS